MTKFAKMNLSTLSTLESPITRVTRVRSNTSQLVSDSVPDKIIQRLDPSLIKMLNITKNDPLDSVLNFAMSVLFPQDSNPRIHYDIAAQSKYNQHMFLIELFSQNYIFLCSIVCLWKDCVRFFSRNIWTHS